MSIEFSKRENSALLEADENREASKMETGKNDEGFVSEILSKIENEINNEPSSRTKVDTIDSSIELVNPTVKEEAKKELDLDSNLNALDNETRVAGEEAKSKISEISGFSKTYHHPGYRKNVARQIYQARKTNDNPEKIRSEFYERTEKERENFESQEKERSVAEIMKEKDLVVVHGIPLRGEGRGSQENNMLLKASVQQKVNFEDSFEMIAGLSPTISASIPSPDRFNNGLFKKTGIILGEGRVLSAQSEDAGSVAHGLYKRIPKYGTGERHTAVQPEINIEEVVKEPERGAASSSWNELTVENPKVAGLFYDISFDEKDFDPNSPGMQAYKTDGFSQEAIEKMVQEFEKQFLKTQEFELSKMKEISEKMNVPLYIFKNEDGKLNKYKVTFVKDPNITLDYLKNVLVPQGKEILARNDGDFSAPEYVEFMRGYNRAYRIFEGKEYTLNPVTAGDIYESKRNIKSEERKKMIEDIKGKGIISETAGKEVDKKLKDLTY